MTRDDIIALARSVRDGGHWNQLDIIRFALLVAAAEREACAKVLDDWKKHNWTFEDCAAVIRARGQE